jgi:hypothetical protein
MNNAQAADGFSFRKLYFYITENVHAYSLIVFVLLDLLWNVLELVITIPVIGPCLEVILIGLIFGVCFLAVYQIQQKIAGDDQQTARTKGMIFGVLAALPFSLVGWMFAGLTGALKLFFGYDRYATLAGKVTLAWAQLEKNITRLLPASYINSMDENTKPISQKLQYLRNNGSISQATYDDLTAVRHIRNSIAHWNSRLPNEGELQYALDYLTRLNMELA